MLGNIYDVMFFASHMPHKYVKLFAMSIFSKNLQGSDGTESARHETAEQARVMDMKTQQAIGLKKRPK